MEEQEKQGITKLIKHDGQRSRAYVEFQCSVCGKTITTRYDNLPKHSGKCSSCVKIGKANAYKHGGSKTRLHHIWRNMKNRRYKTYNPTVCEEWQTFPPFRDWALSHGYAENLTIDRINPRGDYEPSNCQWITREENAGKDKRIFNDRQKDAIYAFRKFLGLTKKEMASALNVSTFTIAKIEREVDDDIKRKIECDTE